MNIIAIKTIFFLALIIAFIIMAITTNDAGNRQLFAALGIITGAIANKSMSGNIKAKE